MHLQTIVHSVAFFGIENAAAPVSGQPREIHSRARFGLQDESVQGIARESLPLKASAAQAVAAFFTRIFYHTPGRLSSIFMREFEILCLSLLPRLSLWESWCEALERLDEGQPARRPPPDSTSPSSLTRCHLPYRGEALAFRKVFSSYYTCINFPNSSEYIPL